MLLTFWKKNFEDESALLSAAAAAEEAERKKSVDVLGVHENRERVSRS